ncbi:BlaI/MecI/CopY family transcriptional regulator [Actinospica acidithermotolerans]|uniref:BlaI/MecI/CopY family transcriptional regulator n=1 Tax=Actinospica acidithermotolerans TaxID=2828514 RepID=UPI001BA9CB2F|nr:BlaI/MecI/CopY family transcriptional regulator [Actinospica acidithermotolerans]
MRRERPGGGPGDRGDDGPTLPEQGGAGRRAAGELESAVLGVLWNAREPLSPGEVRELLARTDGTGAALSYSTVVTILTRLHEKGSLSRHRDGRAFRYAPVSDEAGLEARRLSQLLDRSADREAVLSRFVADLSERDEELLRSLLGGAADGLIDPQCANGGSTAAGHGHRGSHNGPGHNPEGANGGSMAAGHGLEGGGNGVGSSGPGGDEGKSR